MFRTLMRSRRFAPLFWCQFFSAFNDNFVRQMLAMLILFRFGAADAGAKVSLAVAIFVLPSIPLSPIGGEIADAHDKAAIARKLKFAEIFVQLIAAAGFYFSSLALLYLALFGLGCIAALFGPIKYGILPDHLKSEELVAGNALVEGATFAAIICGLVVGGYAAAAGREPWTIVAQLLVVAAACYAASLYIPATGVGAPGLKVDVNPWRATRAVLRELRANDRQWVGAIAVSWFWTVGAITLSLVPVIVKSRIGGGVEVETAINLVFAIGIAAGSLLAAVLAHGRIQLAPAPLLLLAMAALAIDLGLHTGAMPSANGEIGLAAFFSGGDGRRIVADVLAYSCAAGLFVVPIFAAVQAWSSKDKRARVIGAVNTLNSIYMVVGSLATTLLLKLTGLSESAALVLLGIANVVAAIYFFARLPASLFAFAARAFWRVALRLELVGGEGLPGAGEPSIVAIAADTPLGAPIVLSLFDEPPLFAFSGEAPWWAWPPLRLCEPRRLDPSRLGPLIVEVRRGRRLAIVVGEAQADEAAALIAEASGALLVPARVEATSGGGTRVAFPAPRRIAVAPHLSDDARRRAARAALAEAMSTPGLAMPEIVIAKGAAQSSGADASRMPPL